MPLPKRTWSISIFMTVDLPLPLVPVKTAISPCYNTIFSGEVSVKGTSLSSFFSYCTVKGSSSIVSTGLSFSILLASASYTATICFKSSASRSRIEIYTELLLNDFAISVICPKAVMSSERFAVIAVILAKVMFSQRICQI